MSRIKYLIVVVIWTFFVPSYSQEFSEDWSVVLDTTSMEDDVLPDFDWSDWSSKDWKHEYKDEYQDYYQSEEALGWQKQAFEQATEQGINVPSHHQGFTYDPNTQTMIKENETQYIQRLEEWMENLQDDLTETGKDVALNILYTELEPILKVLREKNAALLEAILPQMQGVPVHDMLEDYAKEHQEGKRNFQYWVKLAAENIMQSLFKKNAEGKYELQREKVELLKQVGLVRFLKLSALDWEVTQSVNLEIPDEVLSYARAIQEIYQSGRTTFQAGKDLYQDLISLDTELNIPAQLDQLRSLVQDVTTNRLTINEMVSKRKQLLALTYRQLAQKYRQYSEDLNVQLKANDQLKMSDAERMKAMQIAHEYLSESLRLQAKAEELLGESYLNTASHLKNQYIAEQNLYDNLNYLIK